MYIVYAPMSLKSPAWQLCWADNLSRREEGKAEVESGSHIYHRAEWKPQAESCLEAKAFNSSKELAHVGIAAGAAVYASVNPCPSSDSTCMPVDATSHPWHYLNSRCTKLPTWSAAF